MIILSQGTEKYYVKRGKKGYWAHTECGNWLHGRDVTDPTYWNGVLCPKCFWEGKWIGLRYGGEESGRFDQKTGSD